MRRREAVREKGLRRSLPKTNRFFDSYRYRYRDTATGFAGGSVCQNASQSLPHLRQIKSNLFCGGACTRRKIQYRTQVCSLSASSGQRARAASGKRLCRKTQQVFRQAHKAPPTGGALLCIVKGTGTRSCRCVLCRYGIIPRRVPLPPAPVRVFLRAPPPQREQTPPRRERW